MDKMTSRQLKGLFLAVEINLLTWLGVAFAIWKSNADVPAKHMVVFGCVLALGLQHWGYYNLYKRAKKQEKENTTEPRLGGDFGTCAGRGFLSASKLTLTFQI